MKAAIYPGGGQPITIETLPDPEPGPQDVLIRVHRCGICGTDLAMTKGTGWDYGRGQFGHEYAGEIVDLGRDVAGLRIGQKVAVLPSGACGHCPGCATGNHILCRNAPGAMRGFAELATVPAALAVPLPDTLSMADGALIEPLAVSLYGVRMSRLSAGEDVVVLGGGTVALYTIYWARALGARRIIALSRSSRRRALALAMGADAFIPLGDAGDDAGTIAQMCGGAPAIVYECVGIEGMLARAITLAGLNGEVVSLGFCTRADPVIPALAAYKCISLRFLAGYTMRDFLHIADHLGRGHTDPKLIVTQAISLTAMPAMFETLRSPNHETKIHVHCHGEHP